VPKAVEVGQEPKAVEAGQEPKAVEVGLVPKVELVAKVGLVPKADQYHHPLPSKSKFRLYQRRHRYCSSQSPVQNTSYLLPL
jgi:hypothetical protein